MTTHWQPVPNTQFEDILFDQCDGIARIAINRPHARNAFRPETILELQDAFARAHRDPEIGVIIFTGVGPDAAVCTVPKAAEPAPALLLRALIAELMAPLLLPGMVAPFSVSLPPVSAMVSLAVRR